MDVTRSEAVEPPRAQRVLSDPFELAYRRRQRRERRKQRRNQGHPPFNLVKVPGLERPPGQESDGYPVPAVQYQTLLNTLGCPVCDEDVDLPWTRPMTRIEDWIWNCSGFSEQNFEPVGMDRSGEYAITELSSEFAKTEPTNFKMVLNIAGPDLDVIIKGGSGYQDWEDKGCRSGDRGQEDWRYEFGEKYEQSGMRTWSMTSTNEGIDVDMANRFEGDIISFRERKSEDHVWYWPNEEDLKIVI